MSNLFSLLLSVIVSVIVSVVVAVLSYFGLIDTSILNSLLLGLLSFFIWHVIATSVNSDRLSKDITEIKARLTTESIVKSGNNFDYYWMSCFDKARAGTYILVSENCIKIPQAEIRLFWQRSITNTDNKWECTHYINDPKDFSPWHYDGFDLQGSLIKIFGLHVKRLFIFDKKENIRKDLLKNLENIGIEIRILILENETKWSGHERLKETLDTLDMAIIDDTYLTSYVLKESTVNSEKVRSLNYVNFCSEAKTVKKVQQIYRDMWINSLTIPD